MSFDSPEPGSAPCLVADPRRITVIGVGTPPPVTSEIFRPLVMEVICIWEAKEAAPGYQVTLEGAA